MKKGLTAVLAGGLLAFYMGIILYIFSLFLYTDAILNFKSAILFEIISFVPLTYIIMSNLLSKCVKTGFLVPLIMITIAYTVILNVINLVCISFIPHTAFVLINIVLLYIYCLVSIPVYIMGKR